LFLLANATVFDEATAQMPNTNTNNSEKDLFPREEFYPLNEKIALKINSFN